MLLRWAKTQAAIQISTATGSTTLQVSADMGATWTVISDSGHGFGPAVAIA